MAIVNRYGFFKALSFGVAFLSVTFIVWGTVSLGLWYGGYNVVDGLTTLGDYFKVCGLMIMTVMSLIQTFAIFPEFTKSILSEAVLLKVIKRKPEIPFKGGKSIENLKGNISFRNVDFIYPARPNTTVLKDFSLDIKQGQSVALVGPSGSGKSTIVGLVEKFYNPNAGQILIDGVDILEIDPMFIHHKIGIVTQEPVLFAASIKENIAYAVGLENVTHEQIVNAAKLANCHNFIMDLPDEYDTLLGEKGVSMSGGQKQRIAIARALIQNPIVLLLDEATSALDTESEALVQEALDNLMKGRTTICIAHRLSTIKNSDVICVLVKGKLVEKGKHDDLLEIENGVYRKLAEKQMAFKPKREDAEETLDIMEENDEIDL
ncbi:predicted protein [Naegleria gruberi]|uniref:Predicted protein n=1 Tax=Naegleria gruberi TaxID=5762 RepID=D2W038_NAEGR|nr:uncharacterized protein NAEGRDRAFT_60976 [Naegleria gruberi]EFC37547.1 predicted protein [Naegleria gruberi]|eukprot:XP_002670291.1 predicted protein [Naegleria gruberi strain NEG-M]